MRFAGCYHFVESYCQLILLKKMTKYNTKYSCNCTRNTNVCFSSVCMQVKLVNVLTYVPILRYKNGIIIP